MNDSLYRLVYVSRNVIAGGEGELTAEIASILESARRLNAEADITGALMYNRGCFAQVLEGPRDALQDTFERIQCDERHEDVHLLGFEPTVERGFGEWSMAYVGQSERSREAFAGLAPDGGFEPEAMPPERIYTLLVEHLADGERGRDVGKAA